MREETVKEKVSTELEYFNGDELAASVWRGKYALDTESNPDDMHLRLASEFARIEENYQKTEKRNNNLSYYGLNRDSLTKEKIFYYFKDFKYIVPQGSIMSMLGSKQIGSLSNCFVIAQPEDSYSGILKADEELVQLMKRRGGVGVDISTLRPSGTKVSNAAKSSTGAVSFMERFSNSTREVAQGGRRGALMLTIDCRHPDVFDFVTIKSDKTKVTGANISVMLRDDFMQAVKDNTDYILRFPCNQEDISKASVTKTIKAKELYDLIVKQATEDAEPGQMFIDKQWNYSPDSVYPQYKGVTTNPCGEIFMQPYDACRLICLNLYSFIDNPFTQNAKLNKDLLYEVAYEQQRLADDIVDLELEHISRIIKKIKSDPQSEEIKFRELNLWTKVYDTAKSARRTGCGFTALGDMLAALNLPYDSEGALEATELVNQIKMQAELDCTIDLAISRGTFTGWNRDLEFTISGHDILGNNSFYSRLLDNFPEQANRMIEYGRRNISWSTVNCGLI